MEELFQTYWPHLAAAATICLSMAAAIHAAMTKDDVRAAIGWIGVILLSPVLGALIYIGAGVNRIRRKTLAVGRSASGRAVPDPALVPVPDEWLAERCGPRFVTQRILGDRVTHHALTAANAITLLDDGDATYGAMIAAIEGARRSVLMESYIFDRDRAGIRLADALIRAAGRGVEVRVLVDAVGARYSRPTILRHLRRGGVRAALFNGRIITGLRLPYANLRTHRKILVVDGQTAFAGGMNIREGFTREFAGEVHARDTHFRLTGPVVADLFTIAAEDWHFATDERLTGAAWAPAPVETAPDTPMIMRAVPSGPDASLETNHRLLMGAFSVAQHSIRIMSPYFLPDRELLSALNTAARRGVEVDIVVPANNNLTLVDRAMQSQFDQVLVTGCRIWRQPGVFDHSKLLCVDGTWAYVGSSNLDPRSLRLNFEVDVEIFDPAFAARIEARIDAAIAGSSRVSLAGLRARPLPIRLMDRVFWLCSPYL